MNYSQCPLCPCSSYFIFFSFILNREQPMRTMAFLFYFSFFLAYSFCTAADKFYSFPLNISLAGLRTYGCCYCYLRWKDFNANLWVSWNGLSAMSADFTKEQTKMPWISRIRMCFPFHSYRNLRLLLKTFPLNGCKRELNFKDASDWKGNKLAFVLNIMP